MVFVCREDGGIVIEVARVAGRIVLPGQTSLLVDPGKVYRATVLGQEATTVLLRMAGGLLRGSSELNFAPGQILHLQAEVSPQGSIVLRIVPQPTAPATQDLGQALLNMELPANATTQMLVRTMLSWMMPITPAALQKTLHETRDLPEKKLVAYLHALGWGNSVGIAGDAPQLEEGNESRLNLVARFLIGDSPAQEVPLALLYINETEQSPLYPTVRALWWEDGARHGELFVLRDGRHPEAGPQQIHVALRIHTLHYGELWLAFSHGNGQLDLSCYATDDLLLKRIADSRPAIAAAVEAAGATLSSLQCHERLALSVLDVFPPAQLAAYQAVDIRV